MSHQESPVARLAAEDPLHDPPHWRFDVRRAPTGGRITAFGELDLAVAAELEELAGALVPEPGERLVADLSGVTFTDSSIVAFLLRLAARAEARGASLVVLAQPDGHVRRTLRACEAETPLGLSSTG
jgi:anti-sigma B factor antagonist